MARARRKYNSTNKSGNTAAVDQKGEDSCNAFSLSSKDKRKRRAVLPAPVPKKLSKKQRKKLEKVVDQKQKKERRSDLLSSLATNQIDSSELALFDSVAHLGTQNSKLRILSKRPLTKELRQAVESRQDTISQIKGWKLRRKVRKINKKDFPLPPKDEDSSDLSSSSEEEVEEKEKEEQEEESELDERKKECDDEIDQTIVEKKIDPQILENKNKEKGEIEKEKKEVKEEKSQSIEVKPTTYIHVDRTDEMQKARLFLPILAEEQTIMEAIKEHSTVIVCGQTGSGKTTQVPQFLYEAGFANEGLIGITEPRRVAAVSMSKRVATEMNLPTSKISYHIRYDNNVTSETCMKFMTDGILNRELKEDFLLTKYSVIILDEAHERTANTDVLIGLLSRIVPLRNKKGKPLKLIIMSATLRVEDFTKNERLFKIPPPVMKVDARQFSVSVHFNKKTPISTKDDKFPYLDEAYKKICKIHRTLPPGGILVFVTGRQEVHALKRKLNATFPIQDFNNNTTENIPKGDKEINLDDYKTAPSSDNKIEIDESNDLEISDDEEVDDDDVIMDDTAYTSDVDATLPLYVLPLYSLLEPARQKRVFDPVPVGSRLCVVATNVAETSLTIPGVKYVVDTGKVKRRLYDKVTGISSFRVTWISKASANQRAGRAGRTECGHAYRLYSSAVFQDFDEFDIPEIASRPVTGLVLQMKSMKIDRVINFPFPSPPPHEALESAEKLLNSLGAIQVSSNRGSLKDMRKAEFSGTITDIGKLIALFPVHPRFGKMIAMATKHDDVIAYVITIVAALTVRELFFTPTHDPDNAGDKEKCRQIAARLRHLKSLWSSVGGGPERKLLGDLMVLLGAIGAVEYSGASSSVCISNCLRQKAVIEIRKLRAQLTNVVNHVVSDRDLILDPKMEPPSDEQVRLLRQIVLSALGDHVAKKIPVSEIPSENRKQMRGSYQSLLIDEAVFIHPDSVLSVDPLPLYLVYQEIMETGNEKSYMKDITAIEPQWLATRCSNFCKFSKPLDSPEPRYDLETDEVKCHVTATYGHLAWSLGEVEITYPPSTDRYRWFARFLLEGEVVTSLKPFVTSLLSRPAIMIKSWANLQPRTQVMLNVLINRQVDSKKKLLKIWSVDPSYLRNEFLEWLPQSVHDKFLTAWPSL